LLITRRPGQLADFPNQFLIVIHIYEPNSAGPSERALPQPRLTFVDEVIDAVDKALQKHSV
jgi:hypothetical protein